LINDVKDDVKDEADVTSEFVLEEHGKDGKEVRNGVINEVNNGKCSCCGKCVVWF
jgi:hypothetical protein